jgi:selenocysteine lyase/cysteine desulfurase
VRLVAVSFVQFQTGLRMPLESMGALCREHGAELCVDAIQGVGAVPFDVEAMHIDYACGGGHKWLLGTEGAAYTYVQQERAASLRPYSAGWLSHEAAETFLFAGAGLLDYERPLKQSARVFETGTSSLLSLAALQASAELIHELGPAAIFEQLQRYHDALEPELERRGFSSLRARETTLRSGILSVLVPEGVEFVSFVHALERRGIAVGMPDGHLRFAPHFANRLSEVNDVVCAVDEALSELRP